jgi:tRNA wybutosine-synthesizing protein 3
MSIPPAPSLPPSFIRKKAKILSQLAVPAAEYDDLSPKGSIDDGIRDLIDEINACEAFVTTSSCAGRVSVFLEGQKKKIQSSEGRCIQEMIMGILLTAGLQSRMTLAESLVT